MAKLSKVFGLGSRNWTERATGTNAAATATRPSEAGLTHYCSGFMISASAAPASPVTVEIRENSGGTILDDFEMPASAFLPLIVEFKYPIECSVENIDLDINLPALGAGVIGRVSLYGFTL